jgi:hypothetical protein
MNLTSPRSTRLVLLGAATALLAGCTESPASVALDRREDSIVNGIKDTNHRYVVGVGGNTSAFCTGTVISKRTVLTAGHCIGGVRNIFLGPRVTGGMGTKIPVVQQIRHPQYADLPNENATYDLGILQLGADAPVQSVPLLRETMNNTPRFIGPSYVIVGYGITGGGQGGFGTKRVTTFPIHVVGPAVVGGSYPPPDNLPETLWYYLNSETGGRNACNGDSGGPGFFVTRGVETLAGVTSSGDASCMLDGTDQRSDQPYIDGFIQEHIDDFEGADNACRSNGVCDESCNLDGQLGDPDCAFDHCGADGICAEACVAPLDPDCTAIAADNCGDNGVCDPTCDTDPDCVRDCGAEGNCLTDCATPDPDCTPASPPDAAPVPTPDAAPPGPGEPDAAPPGPGQVDAGGNGEDLGASGSGCSCRVGGAGGRTDGLPWWPIPLILLSLGLGARGRRLRTRRG